MTLLSLCELAAVKRRLGITDTENDTLLSSLIVSVSAAVERYLDRKLFAEERTDYYNVTSRYAPIPLRAFPISAISSVKSSADWDWANVTARDASDYDFDNESGLLYFQSALAVGPRALQVVYTAGLTTTAALVASTYPDLASAAEMQVVEEFIRRDSQGAVTYSLTDGGGTGQQQGLMLLPAVKERLRPWRRLLV